MQKSWSGGDRKPPTISQPSVGAREETVRALAETPSQFLSVLMTPITFCPPAAAHGSEPEAHQFFGRHEVPISAHVEADGEIVSNGIAFEDYTRMQTSTARHGRRSLCRGIPEWTRNQSTVRAVLVAYFEARAFSKKQRLSTTGTEAERLKTACDHLRAKLPAKLKVMDELCNELVASKNVDGDRQRVLRRSIETLDTDLRLTQENAPAVILGMLYQAYNVGQDSVGVGAMFGFKPPHVRAILHRLNKTYKQMTPQQDPATMEIIVMRPGVNDVVSARLAADAEKKRRYYHRRKEREDFIARYRAEHGWPATAGAGASQAQAS